MARREPLGRGVRTGLAAVTCALLASGPAHAAQPEPPQDLEMALDLHGAVFQADAPKPPPLVLTLAVSRAADRWEPVVGMATRHNKAIHFGRVEKADAAGTGVRLALAMRINNDPYVKGGLGAYEIALAEGPDASLSGSFKGTYKGVAVSGKADGRLWRGDRASGRAERPDLADRPRLLFRRQDLPALREKARTPFGQEALKRMTDAVGLAVRYQVTGDRELAAQAREAAAALVANQDGGHGAGRRAWGPRLEQVAVTYDLCRDAWPAEFRRDIERHMLMMADRIFNCRREWAAGEFSWALLKHGGRAYAGVAFMGLAMAGNRGPEPARPADPYADRPAEAEIAPAAGYRPGPNVPVLKFAGDRMPEEWIYVGGFKPAPGEDPLAALGGAAAARPDVGAKVAHAGREETFRPLSHEPDKGYWAGQIDVTSAIGRIYFSTSYFYTVLDNDGPRWVQVLTDHGGAAVYLAGVMRRPGDFARLDRGLYPFLVEVPILDTRPWGRIGVRPRLKEVSPAQRAAHLASVRRDHEERLKEWQADLAQWNATGGLDPETRRAYLAGRMLMRQYLRECMDSGGFPRAMSYDGSTDALVARYALAHQSPLGEPATHLVDFGPSVEAWLQGRVPPLDPVSKADQRGQAAPGPAIFGPLIGLLPADRRQTLMPRWRAAADAAKAIEADPVMAFLYYVPAP